MKSSGPLAVLLVALAIVFAALAVFYFTVRTSLLASETAVHYKHAFVFTALAVLSLIAANFARPKAALR